MGWWKVQGTEHVVGDDVFFLLREAALAAATAYECELGRRPSREEWALLIRDSLEPFEHPGAGDAVSLFLENGRPSSVDVQLAPLPSSSGPRPPG